MKLSFSIDKNHYTKTVIGQNVEKITMECLVPTDIFVTQYLPLRLRIHDRR